MSTSEVEVEGRVACASEGEGVGRGATVLAVLLGEGLARLWAAARPVSLTATLGAPKDRRARPGPCRDGTLPVDLVAGLEDAVDNEEVEPTLAAAAADPLIDMGAVRVADGSCPAVVPCAGTEMDAATVGGGGPVGDA